MNMAWQGFAFDNDAAASVCEGVNYLAACDRARRDGDGDAIADVMLIIEISDGRRQNGGLEYACHSPTAERWFLMKVSRFASSGPVHMVVAHEKITQRRRSEIRARHLARHDPLTDCAIRAQLADRAVPASPSCSCQAS
ncbi:hypothetical protein, partial [Cereibacter changlensis]